MAWMPPLHLLLAPITADTGATIEQVQLKPLYYAAQKDALARAGDDEDDQFFELAKLATGLSEKELDQLKRPDYVTIAQYVHDTSTRPASFFLGETAAVARDHPVHAVAVFFRQLVRVTVPFIRPLVIHAHKTGSANAGKKRCVKRSRDVSRFKKRIDHRGKRFGIGPLRQR